MIKVDLKAKKQTSKESYHDESKEDNGETSALKIKHENITPDVKASPGLREETEKIKTQALKSNLELKEIQSKAQRLEGEIENKNKTIEKLNEEILNKNDAYNKLKEMYEITKKENEDLRLEQQTFAVTSEEVGQLRIRLNEKNDELAELMEKNDGLMKEIEGFRQQINKINEEKVQGTKDLAQEIDQLKEQIEQLQTEKLQIEEKFKLSADKENSLEQELKEVVILINLVINLKKAEGELSYFRSRES